MYKIEGDGSYNHTKVWRDGALIDYVCLDFVVLPDVCTANVDGIGGRLDQIIIKGIYTIVGQGSFSNTKVIANDDVLHGIQAMYGTIMHGEHSYLELKMVMLPNLVEETKKDV